MIRFAEVEDMTVEDARKLIANPDPEVEEYARKLIEDVIADMDRNESGKRESTEA